MIAYFKLLISEQPTTNFLNISQLAPPNWYKPSLAHHFGVWLHGHVYFEIFYSNINLGCGAPYVCILYFNKNNILKNARVCALSIRKY